ncbi:MAG: ABC transporter permease [Verrucomicrobiota bacterium]|nr:ABC transporter permease [Verrucomicrobiota bacterium]
MLQEIRFAFRRLAKSPAFVVIAVITLALAIGANTAVLSLVNALLIRPLPYRAPQQLVLLLQHFKSQNLERIPVSPPEFIDYQSRAKSFEKLGAFGYADFNLASGDKPERISGALVTADVFPLLGVTPIKGRFFEADECQTGRDDVVIISDRLWRRKFNRDPQILGTKLLLDGKGFTVVGIMPEGFDFPLQLFNLGAGGQFGGRADIWQPLAFTDKQLSIRYSRSYFIVGRLEPGISVARAQAEIETINGQMRSEHRDNYSSDTSFGGDVLPLQELAVAGMRPTLLILLAAVALVLLIACANLTTMLLARAAAHEREMAIRVALGAGPLRLLKQVLTESVMLALFGGAAGVLLAVWGVDLLKNIGAQTVPRLREVNLDLRVLMMTFAVAVGTGIVFGLIPGLASAKPELTESLKEGGRSSTEGRRRNRLRNALVIAEVALALVLLTSAGLLMKSFVRLQNVNPGFDPHHVLTMEVSLPKLQYPDDKAVVQFSDEAQRRIAMLPGVQAVGLTTILPLAGTNSDSSFAIEGRPNDRNTPSPDEEKREVSPDYFRAIGIPLVKGRFFTQADKADAPLVIIINQAFAKKFWPNEEAVGKRIVMGGMSPDPKWITIVGIVGDIRHAALDAEPKPEMYVPFAQDPYKAMILTVRSVQDPRALVSAIRGQFQAIDPGQPLANIRMFDAVIAESVAPRRLSVVLLGVFAGVAVLLATVGIYGVMSFLVVQRTHEIGVRMALGAQRTDVMRLVIGRALKLIVAGTAIGLLMALLSTRALQALLYRVSAFDAPTFLFVTFILGIVALAASYLPAQRATRADPMIALSHNA